MAAVYGLRPDVRSTGHLVRGLLREHRRAIAAGILLGICGTVVTASVPVVIGRAVDDRVESGDSGRLWLWGIAVLLLGIAQVGLGVVRHRKTVTAWLSGLYRTVGILVEHAVRAGAELPRRVSAAEAVAVGIGDANFIAGMVEMTMVGGAAAIGLLVVSAFMVWVDPVLGSLVLVGVPVIALITARLLRPLHRSQAETRARRAETLVKILDIIQGLRVLRSIGGGRGIHAAFLESSAAARDAAVRLSRYTALLGAIGVLLPGVLIALVVWVGLGRVRSGALTPGELITFYAFAAYLGQPLRTLIDAVDKYSKGLVAARRMLHILRVEPFAPSPRLHSPAVPGEEVLVDRESGVAVRRGELVAVAASDPAEAADAASRLGGFAEGQVLFSGTPLADHPRKRIRECVLLGDNDAMVFSGILREQLAPRDAEASRITAALAASAAGEIVEALPDGLATEMIDPAREFSGGQLQRLRLARCLLADPPILVLSDPTSAVDAHTEALMGEGLKRARSGRTTVVFTTSALLLAQADRVQFLDRGRVRAEGPHRDLLNRSDDYRRLVMRGMG
ncbi:ABC transporter transmembrane domain-containing protein [Embleya sp. NPDC001921]